MDRRTFLGTLAGGFLTAPVAGGAQQTEKVFRIGYLSGNSAESDTDLRSAFRQGFAELGYVEGGSACSSSAGLSLGPTARTVGSRSTPRSSR